jgi:hypothetical protein
VAQVKEYYTLENILLNKEVKNDLLQITKVTCSLKLKIVKRPIAEELKRAKKASISSKRAINLLSDGSISK